MNPDASGGNRAIVQGSGFLYFRTVGGPTGDTGPFYGPYEVSSGSSFKTADIPAGSYSDIGVIFSANRLDETKTFTWKSGTYTFAQLMRLGDTEFNELTSSNAPIDLNEYLNGEVSTGLLGKVTLSEGKTTELAVVLIPSSGGLYEIDLTRMHSLSVGAQPTKVRKFFCLSGVSYAEAVSELDVVCAVIPGAETVTLGVCALYGPDGVLVSSFEPAGALTSVKTLTAAVKPAHNYYLYLEYQALSPFTLSFSAIPKGTLPVTEPPVIEPPVTSSTMTVNFTGDNTLDGKTLYYAVYDISGMSSLTTEQLTQALQKSSSFGEALGMLCGYGAIVLDGSGSGSGIATDFSGGSLTISPEGLYVVTAFIDVGDRYTGTVAPLSTSMVKNMVPRVGDRFTDSLIYFPMIAPEGLAFTNDDLEDNYEYVYFVSQDGVGLGLTADDPSSFVTVNNNFFSSTDFAGSVVMYLTGDVTSSNAMLVRNARVLAGAPGLTSPPKLNVGKPEVHLMNSDENGSSLIIHNLSIIGSGAVNTLVNSLFNFYNVDLILGNNSSISNFTVSNMGVNGGMLHASGGSSIMMIGSAEISAISTDEPLDTSSNGGAIYLDGSSLAMYGTSSITGCSGWQNGGAIFMTGGSPIVTLNDSSSISLCSANGGGAIFSESGSVFLNGSESGTGVRITGCTAQNGGGLYLYALAAAEQFTISGNSFITGNQAAYFGGGVFYGPVNYPVWDNYGGSYIIENHVDGTVNNIEYLGS
jgi:hypothetical protein